MESSSLLEHIDAEVKRLADEATPELLPMLYKIFVSDDRPGLVTCERHMKHLFPYVRAQIFLTRAKRNYYREDWSPPCGVALGAPTSAEAIYASALRHRDELRVTYRSTPCTCRVKHR